MNNIIIIIALVSLVLSVYNLVLTIKFNKLKALFLSGKNGQNLEEALESLIDHQQELREQHHLTTEQIKNINGQLALATQKVGLVRFNPFDDGGGNFSFSLALLDSYQNGVVITSMHGRQQNRIYTKKIIGGKCETDLTQEETEAINKANN